MAVSWYQAVVEVHDLPSLARFWCQVLDWRVLFEDEAEDEIVIGADPGALPGICFVPVGERKTVKNRLHIDLAPDDRDAEVDRLLALGARRVDVGQGEDVTWVVLADPNASNYGFWTVRQVRGHEEAPPMCHRGPAHRRGSQGPGAQWGACTGAFRSLSSDNRR
jgi:hypothetical protein